MHNQKKQEKEKSNPLFFLFKKVWQYSEGNRKKLFLIWAMFIFAEGTNLLVNPQIWAKFLGIIQMEGVTEKNLNTLLLLMVASLTMTLIFWALHGPARVMECNNAFKVRLNYRKFLLRGVMNLPMGWHSDHHSGDTIDKIEKGVTALYQFSEDTFEIIYAIVRFFGSFCMLAYLFPPSSVIVLVMLVITLWIVMRFDKVLIGQYRDLSRAENQVSASTFDSISNIATVIILRVEKLVFNAIIHKVEKPYGLFKKNNWMNELKWSISTFCCTLTVVLVMISYILQHKGSQGGVLFAEVFLLYRYLGNVSEIFSRFTNLYSDTVSRRARVANAEELSEQFLGESFSNHMLPTNWQNLSIKDLSFSYGGIGELDLHLDNVSLDVGHGERIAFIGTSGSGKTTALKIMRGLYAPSSLKLSVDGTEIPNGFDGIARAIALVPQNPEIFTTTIRENITLGADHEDPEILRFVDMACFRDVVEKLPKGFESTINEKGVNLSGGEQQRLALARGLLASIDKDIILLDEPTASLDSVTERSVYGKIFGGFVGKTIISSVHRLHLLPMFDRVCLFDYGKIITSGTFDELLANSQEFQTLWRNYSREAD